MIILFLLLFSTANSLNYFWLDHDPVISASQYCDQHCFKIASEVCESIWMVVLFFAPDLYHLATKLGIPLTYRSRRIKHKLWHPLTFWNGLCRANLKKSLDNAIAILNEHKSRNGKLHMISKDLDFLSKHYQEIDYNGNFWYIWLERQLNCDSIFGLDYYLGEKKPNKVTLEKIEWFKIHSQIANFVGVGDGDNNLTVLEEDRNNCNMTHPPIMMKDNLFPEYKKANSHIDFTKGTLDHIIEAYRFYYKTKMTSMKTKKGKKNADKYVGNLRYFYSKSPEWLIPTGQ